jgi:hypothetical protein
MRPGGQDDDRDHGWGDPVEEGLHSWESLVADVEEADCEDEQNDGAMKAVAVPRAPSAPSLR